jgi:hypothetical protein
MRGKIDLFAGVGSARYCGLILIAVYTLPGSWATGRRSNRASFSALLPDFYRGGRMGKGRPGAWVYHK